MKFFWTTCCSILIFSACSQQTDFSEANITQNKILAASTNKALNGKVTNVPYMQLPISEVTSALQMYTSISGSKKLLETIQLGGVVAFRNDSAKNFPIVCDVTVQQGNLSGSASCHTNNSARLEVFSLQFENNLLNGEIKISDLNNEETSTSPVFIGNMVNGKLDGKFEILSRRTGKTIATGQLATGKLDGEQLYYSADGTLYAKENYTKGNLVNTITYNPQTGQPFTTAIYDEYGRTITDGAKVEFTARDGKGELTDKIQVFKVTEYKNRVIEKVIYYNVDTGELLGELTFKNGRPFNGTSYYMHSNGKIYHDETQKYINGQSERDLEAAAKEAEWKRQRQEEEKQKAAEEEAQAREVEKELKERAEAHFQDCLQNAASNYPDVPESEIQQRCEHEKEFFLR